MPLDLDAAGPLTASLRGCNHLGWLVSAWARRSIAEARSTAAGTFSGGLLAVHHVLDDHDLLPDVAHQCVRELFNFLDHG